MALQPVKRRFTVDEYYRMGEAGIFSEDDRVELLDGDIIKMPPIGPRHAGNVKRLADLFAARFRDVALLSVQDPVRLSQYTEPLPDLALLHRRSDFYTAGHPTPDAVFLLVEVAETTAQFDRRVKAPLYAGSGIVEYWLVDITQDTVTLYRDPPPEGNRTVQTLRRGDHIAPLAFPGRDVAVDDLLGTG